MVEVPNPSAICRRRDKCSCWMWHQNRCSTNCIKWQICLLWQQYLVLLWTLTTVLGAAVNFDSSTRCRCRLWQQYQVQPLTLAITFLVVICGSRIAAFNWEVSDPDVACGISCYMGQFPQDGNWLWVMSFFLSFETCCDQMWRATSVFSTVYEIFF